MIRRATKSKTAESRGGRRLTLYASILSQTFALVRNVLVARLLGPEEFGIAAVIILTINFLDTFSNAGPQNLLVQAKDEDGRPLLAASHSVTLARGLVTSALLAVLGGTLSELFGVRMAWLAVAGLALAALVSGFLHRGVRMAQREGNFRPEALNFIFADFASLVAAVAVAIVTASHVAIVAGLLARSVLLVLTSHVLASEKYEFNWDRQLIQRFWAFGWPLLINGPLLFLAAQADRLFISREVGIETLGIYSAVLVLIASPSGAILKWLGTIFVPPMARHYHQDGNLNPRGVVFEFTTLSLVSAATMLVAFTCLGAFAVDLLYGSEFAVTPKVVALIALLQVIRFLRSWPSTLSIAVAASGGILLSTIIRLLALPAGYAGLLLVGGLEGLLLGFIVGEVLALLVSLLIVNRNASRTWSSGLAPLGVLCVLSLAMTWSSDVIAGNLPAQILLFSAAAPLGAVLLALSISPSEALARARALKLWSAAGRWRL
ncbi:oligosaccharide flippase family protein [uncultured Phenylobacterium sp.]|uniref:oligosaccharide flippase family protein n=1 Tax=uncultured Phenylobacterium sp. TaxID=349273 RepID=UPI0025F8A540|nr:oligosaccharide flippase family protein [uncultured Phenylobacterium sp.]